MDSERPPLFTIGKIEAYTRIMGHASVTGEILLKLGCRLDGYPGGIVFSSVQDARRYINEGIGPDKGYGVYEIEADWEQDCYPRAQDDYWRHLLVDRPIKCLVVNA